VHEREAERTVDVQQRPRTQPIEQAVAIGRKQHFAQFGIGLGLIGFFALRHGEQRKIVIAEHDQRALAERLHLTQHRERLAAAIDQIAAEPQRIARRIEAEFFEQTRQFVVAALHVPNRVDGHSKMSAEA